FGYVSCVLPFEKRRQPEEEKPPDRVCQKFSEKECPGLPISQQAEPRHLLRRSSFGSNFILVTVDIVVFRLCEFVLGQFFGGALQQRQWSFASCKFRLPAHAVFPDTRWRWSCLLPERFGLPLSQARLPRNQARTCCGHSHVR